MNKVLLLGNITKDLELKKTNSGKSVLDFNIATNEGKTASGDDVTQFTGCRAWEKTAENIAQYFKKGNKILVEGRIRTDTQETPNGRRYWTYVLVDRFEFVQPREQNTPQNGYQQSNNYNGGYPTNGYQSNGFNTGYNKPNNSPAGNDSVNIQPDDLPFY